MRFLFIFAIITTFYINVWANLAIPENDEITGAVNLRNTTAFCTSDAFYDNSEATASTYGKPMGWLATGKDVWFKFTATKYDVNISITGKIDPSSSNTMIDPLVALYTFEPNTTGISEMIGSSFSSNNVTSLYKGALTLGQVYYIRVSAANDNTGRFKLCLDNYFQPIKPGQDCGTVSILCSKETFTQLNVSGAGNNNQESAGTCLGRESNSAWYMFKASKAGSFTFVITPTVTTNDIDWVFYDLGIDGDCSKINAATAVRCVAGSGVTCTPGYYKTGLSMTETDLTEASGCPTGQNGFVKYVDLIEGHTYAILIDNFSSGNNGFTIEFDGMADLAGPSAEIAVQKLNPCTDSQAYVFESIATNSANLKWSFGEGASLSTADGIGPYTITYNTPGEKVVVLEAQASNGCSVITTKTFIVAKTPDKPAITASDLTLCQGDILRLSTPSLNLATYHWSGPNGFISSVQNPDIPINGPENAGIYQLFVQVGDCISAVNTIEIFSVDLNPEADFSIITNNRCDPNQSFTFINSSKNYNKITWELGSGISSNSDIISEGKIITYSTPGLKKITLVAETSNGCIAKKEIDLLVEVRPETPVISVNQPLFCLNDVIKLSVPYKDNISYYWSGPNNFTANTNAVEIPITSLDQAGIYSVMLASETCNAPPAIITIPPIARIPVANFYTEPGLKGKFSIPAQITFVNKSTNADFYQWDFGDGYTSDDVNPTHNYTTNGLFKITLTAYSKNSCFTSITLGDLLINKEGALFIPKAFSPNGDGTNDEFIVNITNLKRCQIKVFNRYGTVVFATENINDNWKGIFRGNDLPVGVYYYVVTGKTLDNQNIKHSGSITLIR